MEEKIIKIIYFEFKKQNSIDLPVYDETSSVRIKEASQKAVTELKNLETTEINLPFLFSNDEGPKHLSLNISKDIIDSYNFNNQQNAKEIFGDKQKEKTSSSNRFLDDLKKQNETEVVDKNKRNNRIKTIVMIILIVIAGILAIIFDIQI